MKNKEYCSVMRKQWNVAWWECRRSKGSLPKHLLEQGVVRHVDRADNCAVASALEA
jgi:hypothetical protein